MTRPATCRTCGRPGVRTTEPESWVCPDHPTVALVDPGVLADQQQRAPLLGRILGGKYHLIDVLGTGGFGAVYRGLQAPVGRPVAVKVIRERELERDPAGDLRGRFMREARVISSLRHHATVKLHDFGEDEGLLFMVLELVEGGTLHEQLSRRGPMAPERAVQIMVQVLEALAEAHRKGMVHRDLKPGNVMLGRTPFGHDRVKVLDFGIAKIVDTGPSDGVETSRGVVFGSPAYMAPEQAQGHPVPASDLYAAGVMLYEMLTGVRPFRGENEVQTVLAHIQQPVPDGMEKAGVPQLLADVVRHALAKSPSERITSAQAMADALLGAVDVSPLEDAPTAISIPSESLRLEVTEHMRRAPDDFDDRPTTVASITPSHGTLVYPSAESTIDDPMSAQMRLERYRHRGKRIAIAVIAAIVLGAGIALAVHFAGEDPGTPGAAPATTPASLAAPTTRAPAPPGQRVDSTPVTRAPATVAPPVVAAPESTTPPSVAPASVAPPSVVSAAPTSIDPVDMIDPDAITIESAAPPSAAAAPPESAPIRPRKRRRRPRRKRPRAPASRSSSTDGWL